MGTGERKRERGVTIIRAECWYVEEGLKEGGAGRKKRMGKSRVHNERGESN